MRSTFAVGTGRCGTRFLSELMKQTKGVKAFHEQDPLSDSFLRYVTFYQVPIDLGSCWVQKEKVIQAAWNDQLHYFESSAYLSLNLLELYERVDAKFVLMVRHPKPVINSFFVKGLYKEPIIRYRSDWPPAIQPHLKSPHHHFSRIVAFGEEGKDWGNLSRVGKIAWYWHLINSRVLAAFDQLLPSRTMVVRLEDFTYQTYQDICRFSDLEPTLRERRFTKIAAAKPNRGKKGSAIPNWNPKEIKEYRHYVEPLIHRFGYSL